MTGCTEGYGPGNGIEPIPESFLAHDLNQFAKRVQFARRAIHGKNNALLSGQKPNLLRAADKSIIGGTGCCIQRQEIPEY